MRLLELAGISDAISEANRLAIRAVASTDLEGFVYAIGITCEVSLCRPGRCPRLDCHSSSACVTAIVPFLDIEKVTNGHACQYRSADTRSWTCLRDHSRKAVVSGQSIQFHIANSGLDLHGPCATFMLVDSAYGCPNLCKMFT